MHTIKTHTNQHLVKSRVLAITPQGMHDMHSNVQVETAALLRVVVLFFCFVFSRLTIHSGRSHRGGPGSQHWSGSSWRGWRHWWQPWLHRQETKPPHPTWAANTKTHPLTYTFVIVVSRAGVYVHSCCEIIVNGDKFWSGQNASNPLLLLMQWFILPRWI